MAHLTAIAVGHRGITDEAVGRTEVAAGRLKVAAGGILIALDGFTQGADEVGAEQGVVPGQGRGMAGVVDEDQAGGARRVADAADDYGVGDGLVGIVAGGEDRVGIVPVVAIGSHIAAATGVGDGGVSPISDGCASGGSALCMEVFEIEIDQFAAGQFAAVGLVEAGGV